MGDVIAADQKWHNMHNDDVVLRIDKVNKANSTFAGAYGMKRARDGVVIDWFPLRGEYDPQGITIGWVVSYWTGYFNWNSLDAWAGYLRLGLDQGSKWIIQPQGSQSKGRMTPQYFQIHLSWRNPTQNLLQTEQY